MVLKIERGELGVIFQSRKDSIKELLNNHPNQSPSVKEWIPIQHSASLFMHLTHYLFSDCQLLTPY